MEKWNIGLLAIMAVLMTTLASCDFLFGVFEAGIWVGIIFVVIVVAVIFALLRKLGR